MARSLSAHRFRSLALAAGLWCLAGRAPVLAQTAADLPTATACKYTLFSILPVRFNGHRPLIEASIDGKKGWFLADTGAVQSLIFVDAATDLGLHMIETDQVFTGVGGSEEAKAVTVKDFGLGGALVHNLHFLVAGSGLGARSRGQGDDYRVFGIMGRDLFGQTDVEIDLAHSVIRLFKAEHCERTFLAYWSKDADYVDMRREHDPTAEFILPLSLNGHAIEAELDSGATVTGVSPAAAQSAGIPVDQLPGKGETVHGLGVHTIVAHPVIFASFKIGEEEIKNAKIQVADIFGAQAAEESFGSHLLQRFDGPAMLLGADFLASHRVLIANSQNKVYFSYGGGAVFRTRDSPPEPDPAPPPAPASK